LNTTTDLLANKGASMEQGVMVQDNSNAKFKPLP